MQRLPLLPLPYERVEEHNATATRGPHIRPWTGRLTLRESTLAILFYMQPCLDDQLVLDYLSGSVRELELEEVDQHLGACADCAALVACAAVALLPSGASTHVTTPIAEKVGHFVLEEPLGRGGMGLVFRARHDETQQLVAIKVARSKTTGAAAALRREVQVLQHLRHPGVVRLIEHGTTDGLPWYAMELVTGVTLDRHVALLAGDRRTATHPSLMTIMRRLASTLSYLHGAGVAHRDLTPRNVVIREDGSPVLVDFGLAIRVVDAVEEISSAPSRRVSRPGTHPRQCQRWQAL